MDTVDASIETPDLDSSELYFNRELSWLQFNERVLELAEDPRTPLLERVKFLAIYASNADEFWMVRVAGLNDQVDAGIDARKADGLSPSETLEQVAERSRELDRRHSRQWEDRDSPRAGRARHPRGGPRRTSTPRSWRSSTGCSRSRSSPCSRRWPWARAGPFPYISNLSLSIAVWLRDPVGGDVMFARVKVPKEVLPRLLSVGDRTFVPLEAVIARNLEELFPGMKIMRYAFFRVTRDADFTVSDEADDLLRAVEDELRRRRFGEAVRLEVSHDMDPNMREYLIEQLAIDESQVVDVDGMLDLEDLWALYDVDGHRELREAPWQPVPNPQPSEPEDGRAGPDGGHARAGHPGAPPVPLVHGQRGALRAAGRGRPGRARGEDDRVPDLGRLRAGAVADRGGRAGQAGGVPGGAEGALRRAAQHHLGAVAGGGGRPRGARPARV